MILRCLAIVLGGFACRSKDLYSIVFVATFLAVLCSLAEHSSFFSCLVLGVFLKSFSSFFVGVLLNVKSFTFFFSLSIVLSNPLRLNKNYFIYFTNKTIFTLFQNWNRSFFLLKTLNTVNNLIKNT